MQIAVYIPIKFDIPFSQLPEDEKDRRRKAAQAALIADLVPVDKSTAEAVKPVEEAPMIDPLIAKL